MPNDEPGAMADAATATADDPLAERGPASIESLIDYRRWRWYRFLAAVTAGAVVGGLFLLVAIQRSNPLLGLVGAAIASIAAWGTVEYSAARWNVPPANVDGRRWTRQLATPWRVAILAALALAAVFLTLAEMLRDPVVGFFGLMLLAVGAGPLLHAIHAGTPRRPRRWTNGGLLLAAVAVPTAATGPTFIGVALLAIGLLAVGRGLAGEADPVTIGWVGASFAGVALPFGLLSGVGVLTALGAVAALIAMMALAADVSDEGVDGVARIGVPAVGAALVALAGWFLWATGVAGDSKNFLAFVVAFIALSGASVVWRTAIVFGAVVGGFVFVWGLTASTVGAPDGVASPGEPHTAGIVALGDSYISGEGADEYFAGTDQKGAHPNECRRSPTSYPVLLARLDGGPAFEVQGLTEPGIDLLTCSGATTLNLHEPAAGDDPGVVAARLESLPCRPDAERVLASYPCGPEDQHGWARQLDSLPDDRSRTQLVLLSIGGNDARFGEVVTGCLVPGSCAERREVWLDQLDALGLRLEETYRAVRDAFVRPDGTTPAIVVMPYPLVMTEQRCSDSPFLASEHEFVVEFTTALDQQIEAAAARAGVHYFAPGMFSFVGERVCESASPAINLIDLQPTDGSLLDRMNPGSWTHNSMHPNELGHRLIAERLSEWLNDEGILTGGGPVIPGPDQPAAVQAELLDLRAARTFAVDPATAEALRDDLDLGPNCDAAAIGTFAARIQVFDEATEDARAPAPKVPLPGADPTAVVCATGSDGTWQLLRPDRDLEAADSPAVEGRPRAALESDGSVFLRGGRPGRTCAEPSTADGRDTAVCRHQWVLYSSAPGDPSSTDADDVAAREAARVWNLVVLDYCTVDPACADSIGEWTNDQLQTAATIVLPAAAIVFVGGWMLALGLGFNRRRTLRLLGAIRAVLPAAWRSQAQ